MSAHAGGETLVFEISSLREQFDFGVSMLKELLNDPNFSQDSFLKIKQLTLGELSSKKWFWLYCQFKFKKIDFWWNSYWCAIYGDEQSIEKLKIEDLKEFYKNYFDLSNMLIVVGGDISIDEVKRSLKTLLEGIPVGSARVLKSYVANGDKKKIF